MVNEMTRNDIGGPAVNAFIEGESTQNRIPCECRGVEILCNECGGSGFIPIWMVQRHPGGKRVWRIVLATPFEEEALARWQKEAAALRQGYVSLIDPSGRLVQHQWATRG